MKTKGDCHAKEGKGINASLSASYRTAGDIIGTRYFWLIRTIGLGKTDEQRKHRYPVFVENGVPESEKQFCGESVSRNQLTGSRRFVDEVERRLGLRVERRGRGRPAKEEV